MFYVNPQLERSNCSLEYVPESELIKGDGIVTEQLITRDATPG